MGTFHEVFTYFVMIRVVFLLITTTTCMLHYGVGGKPPQVPCYFIFGDSLVDSGNNNFLHTVAKADYPPHGIDFITGPTGRFCNGRTVADVTAELLGFNNYVPPYASSSDSDLLTGVNYASAAAGIRTETGQHLGDRITLDMQLENHRSTLSSITSMLGSNDSAMSHLSNCLYYVGFGSNDYLNNYFLPQIYPTSRLLSPEQFAKALAQRYHQQLLTLYKYGARKAVLYNLGPIGCTPNEIANNDSNGTSCIESQNIAVQLFNNALKSLVRDLNNDDSLTSAKFVYVNIYDITMEAIADPSSLGFRVMSSACCGVGQNKGKVTCLPFEIPCNNRKENLFWDAYHPTEAANEIAAARSYHARRASDAYPFDIHTLLHL